MGSSSYSKLTKPIRGLKGNAPPGVGEPTLGGIGFTEQAPPATQASCYNCLITYVMYILGI